MPFDFRLLDERTRSFMIDEIQHDIEEDLLYLSDNISPDGCIEYPELLLEAARSGDEGTLAAKLSTRLNSHEKPRRLRSGGYSKAPVMRSNAHEMLAEGEFNRFYMRAICRRAMDDGIPAVVVYRAKQVNSARSASEAMIGERVQAEDLLGDLRSAERADAALGLPPGPNSGLSVWLP